MKESVVFSVKLVDGTNLLTELIVSLESESEYLTLNNPMVINFTSNSEGEVTFSKEFDPLTDIEKFSIPWDFLLTEPHEVSFFYKEFYVKSLIYSFIKKIKFKMFRHNMSPHEFDETLSIVKKDIDNYIKEISLKFDVPIPESSEEIENSDVPSENETIINPINPKKTLFH